ncbi:MAG: UTP--glucose-1-phosphate uridylyltransferase, partial [Polyangiales bacterium]
MEEWEAEVDPETRALLTRYGFDAHTFEGLRARLRSGDADDESNRLTVPLASPREEDLALLPARGTIAHERLNTQGIAVLRAGQVAVVILAGGMATRFGGVVKAAVPVLGDDTFLTLKLRDLAQVARSTGTRLTSLLMTSFATHSTIDAMARAACTEQLQVETFPQLVSLRLQPSGALFHERDGRASPYAPGHGDFSFALRRADLPARLRSAGVRYLFVSNVDNLAATLDPALIAMHVARDAEISFEVVPLAAGDKGGVPARLDGRLQIIEALRYPAGFDERSIPWFSINSFVVNLAAVDRDFDLSWFRVTKQVDGAPVVQFERLVNQLSAHLHACAVAVAREGVEGRF